MLKVIMIEWYSLQKYLRLFWLICLMVMHQYLDICNPNLRSPPPPILSKPCCPDILSIALYKNTDIVTKNKRKNLGEISNLACPPRLNLMLAPPPPNKCKILWKWEHLDSSLPPWRDEKWWHDHSRSVGSIQEFLFFSAMVTFGGMFSEQLYWTVCTVVSATDE